MKQLSIIILLFFVTGCGAEFAHKLIDGTDNCQPEQFRCIGTELQICNADERFERVAECTAFEPGDWACCHNECRKVEECE
ncbi:MAG: hypothetical protein ACYSW0_19985 [Planctomycetota bacterium]